MIDLTEAIRLIRAYDPLPISADPAQQETLAKEIAAIVERLVREAIDADIAAYQNNFGLRGAVTDPISHCRRIVRGGAE